MTPDELYALGYAVQYSAWGAHVFCDTLDHMETLEVITVDFGGQLNAEEAQKRAWEAAAVHFVAARLD